MDQSISVLRFVGGSFHFYSNFHRSFCKQTVKNLVRRRFVQHLIWVCTVCLCPTKRKLGLYGLSKFLIKGKLIFKSSLCKSRLLLSATSRVAYIANNRDQASMKNII